MEETCDLCKPQENDDIEYAYITYKHMDVEKNHKDMKEYSNIIEIHIWIDVAINQKWKIRGIRRKRSMDCPSILHIYNHGGSGMC